MSTGSKRDQYNPVAESVPFDNDTNDFIAEDVQAAIEEVNQTLVTSASPGFSFGRSSNVNSGTWLQCETVPSNKAGRFVYISNPVIKNIFISNEQISTFNVSVYSHEGDEVNLTLIDTVSVVSSRGGTFAIDAPIASGVQLALRITSGSARNIVCGLELSGTI